MNHFLNNEQQRCEMLSQFFNERIIRMNCLKICKLQEFHLDKQSLIIRWFNYWFMGNRIFLKLKSRGLFYQCPIGQFKNLNSKLISSLLGREGLSDDYTGNGCKYCYFYVYVACIEYERVLVVQGNGVLLLLYRVKYHQPC